MPLFNNNAAFAQGYDTYGDSSYSAYPTDDKKYECQTGPFEGFFVSSVEFCKHVKFNDNKRDSKIGPQGPPGPTGATGATGATGPQGVQGQIGPNGTQGPRGFNGTDGAQGPPGITQLINGTNVYLVTVQEFGETFIEASALCDSGDFVLNGGYNYDGALTTEFTDVFKDEPVISPAQCF